MPAGDAGLRSLNKRPVFFRQIAGPPANGRPSWEAHNSLSSPSQATPHIWVKRIIKSLARAASSTDATLECARRA